VCDRGNSGVPGERECEREKNDDEIQMWERGERENRYWTEGEERRCRMCREESETIEYMWSGEILCENGREIRWMKEIWKRRERIEKEKGGE
jgi:hypothetical protein